MCMIQELWGAEWFCVPAARIQDGPERNGDPMDIHFTLADHSSNSCLQRRNHPRKITNLRADSGRSGFFQLLLRPISVQYAHAGESIFLRTFYVMKAVAHHENIL